MDAVLRAAAIYLMVWVLFRLSGKRSLSQITTFDLVLILIIGEATQQALLGQDYSVTNAVLVVATLIGLDTAESLWKQRSKMVSKVSDSVPLLLVQDGQIIQEHVDKARVDEGDILAAARELQGLERMDQIKYAVLERSGGISIIPKQA